MSSSWLLACSSPALGKGVSKAPNSCLYNCSHNYYGSIHIAFLARVVRFLHTMGEPPDRKMGNERRQSNHQRENTRN